MPTEQTPPDVGSMSECRVAVEPRIDPEGGPRRNLEESLRRLASKRRKTLSRRVLKGWQGLAVFKQEVRASIARRLVVWNKGRAARLRGLCFLHWCEWILQRRDEKEASGWNS